MPHCTESASHTRREARKLSCQAAGAAHEIILEWGQALDETQTDVAQCVCTGQAAAEQVTEPPRHGLHADIRALARTLIAAQQGMCADIAFLPDCGEQNLSRVAASRIPRFTPWPAS